MIMKMAYLRDGDVIHSGEALLLAMLLHTKAQRESKEMHLQVARMLDDPNTRNPRRNRK